MRRVLVTMAMAMGVAAMPATAEDSSATVAAARKALAERYVLPDVAPKLAAALDPAHYQGLEGEALATRMNADLAAVTPDKHLGIRYSPQEAAMLAAHPLSDDDDRVPPEMARMFVRGNGGVRALEVLPGNIRYMAYDGFAWGTPEAEAAIVTAMTFLKDGDAIVIDLRRNGGGSPGAVAALASYFVPEGTPLMRFEMRGRKGEETRSPRPPFSLAGQPLYVLVSGNTVSAAEEFATHVSAYGFGTLVGERTAGGGFRNDLVALPGGFVMSISTGRAVSLKTGKDWERVGVTPAIPVPEARALDRAKAEAATAIAARGPADEREEMLAMAEMYRAAAAPVALASPAGDYAGRYGPRVVTPRDGGLWIQRDNGGGGRLIAIGPDRFVAEADPRMRVRFVREGGGIAAMQIERPGMPPEKVARVR